MTAFHRYGSEYWETAGKHDEAELQRRVRLALGPEPLEDALHLLPPLTLPPPAPALTGPHPGTEFVVDLAGKEPVQGAQVAAALTPNRRAALGLGRLWGQPAGYDVWTLVSEAHPQTHFQTLSLCWSLPALLSEGVEMARDLAVLTGDAVRLGMELRRTAAPRESPEAAVRRAEALSRLRGRFGRSVEMRLLPAGRPFPARAVWRAAYALGLRWGNMDLFHALDAAGRISLFTVSAAGQPGYFLPERAAQGEGIPGLLLGFELPRSPDPLAVYDRMAVALAYFRQKLGGHPTTPDGGALDGDRLDTRRDELEAMIHEMARAGIAPGSPEAARFF